MKKNAFLDKQKAQRDAFAGAAQEVEKQFCFDTILITLNREFGFGGERILRLRKAWEQVYREYAIACEHKMESDVYRVKLDRELHAILEGHIKEEEFEPFHQRYNGYLREIDPRKKIRG